MPVLSAEPPSTAPRITINGNSYIGNIDKTTTLVENENYTVSCHVDGGFPDVKLEDITLQCNGADVAYFIPDIKMNGTTCTCKAMHDSGCYDKETDVLVIVICKY